MKLDALPKSTTKHVKRPGRGYGSGKGGHTSGGRGQKGETARVGKGVPLWFEGGQLPMVKRVPYLRGKSRFETLKPEPQLLTLDRVEKLGLSELTPAILKEKNVIRSATRPVKITGVGEISKAVKVSGIQVTSSAKEKIEKAGGSIS